MSDAQKIQWFPGHMTKTKRKIQDKLKLVDAVVEIIDARIPISSRNPDLDEMLKIKPRIILMNKSDMADSTATKQWIDYYQRNNIVALAIDCKSGKGLQKLFKIANSCLESKIESWKKKGMIGRCKRLMVVGVPNVGKSSFINKMCKGNKAKVEDRPGVTRGNQWFSIGGDFELLDTPGVLWPKFDNPQTGENLAFTGAVRDEVIDKEYLAQRLLELLNKEYADNIKSRFKLEKIETSNYTGAELLETVAKKRGMMISGGKLDTERAAAMVLDEFRAAKLGRITLEKVVV